MREKVHFQYSYILKCGVVDKEVYKNLCSDRYGVSEVESTNIESEVTCTFCLHAISRKDERYQEYLIRKGF